jgi:Na+/melibiose symporter-like transporter
MLVIVAMNLSMALYGIINFMGGLGALLVFFGGKPLYDRSTSLPFVVGGLVMFAASLLVVLLIREPTVEQSEGERFSLAGSFRALAANLRDLFAGEKSLLHILLAILCWFIGFNAIETFFTSYAKSWERAS